MEYLSHSFTLSLILSFVPRVHSRFQSEFSIESESNAFCFNFHYPLFFLLSPSSCLRLIPRLPVTYILPFYLSVTNVF